VSRPRIRALPPSSAILQWIVAFKAFKTTLLLVLGVTLVRTARRDPVAVVLHVARAVHLPVTSRLFERALTAAFHLTPGTESVLAAVAFGYAILMGTEGVGLYLRRSWARWFTIIATSSLIPFEAFEIVREPRPLRVLVLLANVGVVWYLCVRKEVFE
jgi:uncharacterized membrane protein (DUF2068 family)